jgi:hypothetical protein
MRSACTTHAPDVRRVFVDRCVHGKGEALRRVACRSAVERWGSTWNIAGVPVIPAARPWVLVVERERQVLRALVRILAPHVDLEAATTARTALELLRSRVE